MITIVIPSGKKFRGKIKQYGSLFYFSDEYNFYNSEILEACGYRYGSEKLKDFFIKTIGYYSDRCDFPYCKSSKDVFKILRCLSKSSRFIDLNLLE